MKKLEKLELKREIFEELTGFFDDYGNGSLKIKVKKLSEEIEIELRQEGGYHANP